MNDPARLPIVFLGPSMPLPRARELLEADYRPPIRRGDLASVPAGAVVGIIDGVFDQDLSVSPAEVHDAVARRVQVIGGGSMGALRAAEVPGVTGIGRIYGWYKTGAISRDDEVALIFDPERRVPLSVPLVNVRFALERLCGLGTIDSVLADRLLDAATALPYRERTYRNIFRRAAMADRVDAADLMAMLEAIDLKREDAHAVLEAIERRGQQRPGEAVAAGSPPSPHVSSEPSEDTAGEPANLGADGGELLVWETGDRAQMAELIPFLGFTGSLERYARAAVSRFALEGNSVKLERALSLPKGAAQVVLNQAARRWGWRAAEEARVTFSDLRLDEAAVAEVCREECTAAAVVRALIRESSPEFLRALRAGMYLDDMALKREVMRLGALRHFASSVAEAPKEAELVEARQVLCMLNQELEFATLRKRWTELGLGDSAAQDRQVAELARARRAGRMLARRMRGESVLVERSSHAALALLEPSPKPAHEARFSLPTSQALEHALRLQAVIGVTRIGMIGELSDIGGVQVAQAARPGNAWSSSYGSGKSRSKDGAIIGSILEETEKWAQEQFTPAASQCRLGSFEDLAREAAVLDPALLDLPYDSNYRPDTSITWYPCLDLLSGRETLVPLDVLRMARGKHDIYYSSRGSRKHMATNGLGSGFTRAEAILHATCEYVERHAARLADLFLSNPGGLGPPPYRFVDLSKATEPLAELYAQLGSSGATVRVLDITSEIEIPTFWATITRDLKRSDGYGAHPNPACAMEMALLEAAQTMAGSAAGGREDLSIHARSLGRHERPRPAHIPSAWAWLTPDPDYHSSPCARGYVSADIRDELSWCLDRVRRAGLEQLVVADLGQPAIAPAQVVRVIIPGLETNNPFYTGARARLVLLRDMLPRWR